jgi:Ca2+-binding EF-hand superfamily protein
MGLLALVLAVTQGLTQFETKNSRSGGFDPRAALSDPNQFFDSVSGNKDVWVRPSDGLQQMMFDNIAKKIGVTNGEITREQFIRFRENKKPPPAGSTWTMPAGAVAGKSGDPTAPTVDVLDARAEEMFRRLDTNGDGVLDHNEMPDDLRNERDHWDTDHNGTIDLNEYKAFVRAKAQQMMNERTKASMGSLQAPASAPRTAPRIEEPKVKVYHYENLPKELPSWFKELDTNHDAQIGLYEWKASGRPLAEFLRMDRNNDGFLTVEEVLWYQGQVTKAIPGKVQVSPGTRVSNSRGSNRPDAGANFDPNGRQRGRGSNRPDAGANPDPNGRQRGR